MGLQRDGGALQPTLPLVELTGPDHGAGERDDRRRDHRFGAPTVVLGESPGLLAARTNGGERAEFGRETELGKAADFEVGAAEPAGERGALGQVAFTVGNPQGPRFNDAQRAA